MKKIKRAIAFICVLSLLCGLTVAGASAADNTTAYNSLADAGEYTINNPYANVNWLTVDQYKADLHSHTNASDGDDTLKDMTEAHYEKDFDIVAVTDHGVIDYGWTNQKPIPAMMVVLGLFDGANYKLEALSQTGTAANGNTYTYSTANGTDYYQQTTANGTKLHQMMRVPYGIEHNPTSLNNAHVNSWFADYGHGIMGGTSEYITPIKNIDEAGGLSVINHPGEYTNARDEEATADAYNTDDFFYNYYINKFAGLLSEYDTCLGIDINSKGDSRTRYDRKLWDILLQKVIPTGRNVFSIATSDAHRVSVVYTGYVMACMEELTVDEFYKSLSNGAYFSASKCVGNYEEVKELSEYLSKAPSEKQKKLGATLAQLVANDTVNPKYEAPHEIEAPYIHSVTVSNEFNTISLLTSDALCIRWIANGKTIAYGNTIDLDDYAKDITCYVRAEIFGEGGIVYTQPFTLSGQNIPANESIEYTDFWWTTTAVDILLKVLAKVPVFDLIWSVMQ